jgi:hypothetical protein
MRANLETSLWNSSTEERDAIPFAPGDAIEPNKLVKFPTKTVITGNAAPTPSTVLPLGVVTCSNRQDTSDHLQSIVDVVAISQKCEKVDTDFWQIILLEDFLPMFLWKPVEIFFALFIETVLGIFVVRHAQ